MKFKIYKLLVFCIVLSSKAYSQDFAKIYAKTIKDCQLKRHLTYLSSDSLKGRDTGSEGQKLAGTYIAKFYEENGLLPFKINGIDTYFQHYNLQRVKVFGGGYRFLPLKSKPSGSADTVKTENVIAYIEGTDEKDEYIIITSHYDHVGVNEKGEIHNGADDDGSGTVAVMELAQAFARAKKAGYGPRRSIIFMNVTGEEKGLLGSKYFVENPVVPLNNIVCNLNIDMIGRTDPYHEKKPDYIYLIGSDKLSSSLHQISEKANETYTQLELDYTYNHPDDPNRFYYRSDHYNFAQSGIPVIFYFRGEHEDYHRPGDDVEKIQFDQLEKVTRLVFHTAWEVANRTDRPAVDSHKK